MLYIIAALSMTHLHDWEKKKGEDSDRSADVNQTRAAKHMAPLFYVLFMHFYLIVPWKHFFISCGFTYACITSLTYEGQMLMLIR